MMSGKRFWALTIFTTLLLAGSATGWAEGGALYDWQGEQAPVMVENDSGVIFLGTDREPRRTYHWSRADGEHKQGLFVVDMDADGSMEVIGGGKPTFALDANSDPLWSIEDGCDQVIVAEFADHSGLDFMCQNGSEITIYTYDRQKFWSADLGVGLDWCRAGDFNGDLKADLECKFRGRNTYVRIDSQGELLAQESDEPKLDGHEVKLEEASPVDTSILEGEGEYDLNGDGTAEESLLADGSALVVQSRSKKKAIARIELDGKPTSALIKNIDGEGNPEIVALTDSKIIVADSSGEKLGTYSADAGSYTRYPVAKLDNVYARNFSDNEKTQAAVEEAQEDLADCYERRVRGGLVVGIGQVILKVAVDDNGDVSDIEKMHSDIKDDTVESCAMNILKGLDYPPRKAADKDDPDPATVNVTLKFTFADKP